MAGVAAAWAVLYWAAVRLYENLAHVYNRRRQRRAAPTTTPDRRAAIDCARDA
jgi:hypothetical protein